MCPGCGEELRREQAFDKNDPDNPAAMQYVCKSAGCDGKKKLGTALPGGFRIQDEGGAGRAGGAVVVGGAVGSLVESARQRMVGARKLMLVLDLDETLLHTDRVKQVHKDYIRIPPCTCV